MTFKAKTAIGFGMSTVVWGDRKCKTKRISIKIVKLTFQKLKKNILRGDYKNNQW